MQKLLKYTVTAFLIGIYGNAQVQNQTQKMDSTLVYRYGEGTFINLGNKNKSTITILSTLQSGIQFNQFDDGTTKEETNRLSINLARVGLNGSFLNNKVKMCLITDFTGTKGLLEAWVGFSLYKKNAFLYFGEKQTHTNNRLAMEDERFAQNLAQTIAGTSNDGVAYGGLMQNFVGPTREGGIFLETNFSLAEVRIYPSVSVTTGDGPTFFDEQTNTGFKYGGRLDIMPLGDFIKNNAFISHDLYREPKLKIVFGIAGSYNAKASQATGSGNAQITGIYDGAGKVTFADYRKIVTDFMLKYRGFSLIGEYTHAAIEGNDLYVNSAASTLLNLETASSKYNLGQGINIQSSYVTRNGWALDTRFSHIEPEFDGATSLVQKENWYTVGVNKFIKNNAIKIGLNTTYVERRLEPDNSTKWMSNLAVQLSF